MEVQCLALGGEMSRKILGLDIRNHAVSAVLVNSGIKGSAINGYAHVPITEQNDIENNIAAALETVLETMNITGSVCITSFPADQISYRNIQVPFKEAKKIGQILPFELEATLPFQVDDLIIDFQPIKFPGPTDHTDIIAAAAEKSKLKSYLDTLASFDIKPEIVTASGYPAARSLIKIADTPEKWLFADIDPNKGTLFAAISGQIILVRSFPISSGASSRTESLCIHIQRTLSAFEEIFEPNFQPGGIFITGCGLDDATFEQDMERTLELPVRRTDLVRDTDIVRKNFPAESWRPEQMDNAFALTLIETAGIDSLNFRKGPFAESKHWAEHKKSFIKAGILAGMVLVLAFFNIMLESYTLGKKLDRLDGQINDIFMKTFPDVKKIVDPLQQMRVKIQDAKKESVIAEATKANIRNIDILYDISDLIPKEIDVDLTRLVIGSETVLISGNTDTFNSVDDMKSRLEQGEMFKKVTISSANIEKSGNRVRFKLKVQL